MHHGHPSSAVIAGVLRAIVSRPATAAASPPCALRQPILPPVVSPCRRSYASLAAHATFQPSATPCAPAASSKTVKNKLNRPIGKPIGEMTRKPAVERAKTPATPPPCHQPAPKEPTTSRQRHNKAFWDNELEKSRRHWVYKKEMKQQRRNYRKRIYYATAKGQVGKATQLLREMEALGRAVPAACYTRVIGCFVDRGDMATARKWVQRMKKHGVAMDVHVYTCLVDGYMRVGDLNKAEGTFRQMIDKGIQPSVVTFNVLMRHAAKKMDIDTAINFFTKLQAAGLQPDLYSYAILIHALGKAHMVDEAWRLFERMKAEGVDPNAHIITTLIGIHTAHRDTSYALQLFDQFCVKGTVPITQHTLNVVLNALVAHSSKDALHAYYDQFQAHAARTPAIAPTITSDPTSTFSIDELYRRTLPSAYTYTTFMRAFLRHSDYAMVAKVYDDMRQKRIQPTVATFSTLMLAHAFVPNPRACENILIQLKDRGMAPNVVMYTIVMRAWGKARQWTDVQRVYQDMKHAGIEPNKTTLQVLRWAKEKKLD
ncbi:hypothetical protein BC940DRAFT_301213 [Gongronella butleri]|nr:hypothetical protein BC940DRAFT_301213 [Gongronella butleri]